MSRSLALRLLPLLLLAPATAQAGPIVTFAPDKNAAGKAQLVRPASLQKLNDLDFAFVTVTGAGTARIDPNTDLMTTTGGVIRAGGIAYAAKFSAVSPTKTIVQIRLPRNPSTLTRVGGTETMTVSDWTMSGSSRRTVVAHEPFEFRVGGTLYVAAGQAEGTYTGTFTVDINYP